MSEKKTYIRLEEDATIVSRIDQIAEAEGTTRNAIIRRFIRRGLGFSLPIVPDFGECPQVETTEQAA